MVTDRQSFAAMRYGKGYGPDYKTKDKDPNVPTWELVLLEAQPERRSDAEDAEARS